MIIIQKLKKVQKEKLGNPKKEIDQGKELLERLTEEINKQEMRRTS